MDANTSNALVKKRKSDLSLMPPPPPVKKIKRPSTVLEEDTYLAGLSHIIARDFFPGLAANEAKHDFLDALESKDDEWIQETSSRLNLMLDGHYTPGRRGVAFQSYSQASTPRQFAGDTPSAPPSLTQEPEKPKPRLNLSLGAYQTKYTSEDNESFNALVDRQNQKNREKHAFLFAGNKIPSARQLAWREREARLIEAAGSSMDLALYRRDTRPAGPDVKLAAPKNAFMFMPDSIEDTHTTVSQVSELKSNAPPKAILYNNTRLTEDGSSRPTAVPASPSLSAINDAIAGRPHLNPSEAGWETPRVAGYAFVDAEPTAAELRAQKGETQVTAKATLSRITKEASSSQSLFALQEASSREKLHHDLVDKINESHRKAPHSRIAQLLPGLTPGKTATPKFSSAPKKDAGHLTPAGQLLFSKVNQNRKAGDRTPIVDFDMTPNKGKKTTLLPGLTPKQKTRNSDYKFN
jgi:protein DGCR14